MQKLSNSSLCESKCMSRTAVLLLLISSFHTSGASADVGLLLGFRGGTTLDRSAGYRTLWITRVEGRVEQEGEWRTIIVPRGDTFCEVEVRPLRAALYTHTAVGAHCEQELQAPTDKSEPPDCTGYNNVDVFLFHLATSPWSVMRKAFATDVSTVITLSPRRR